MKRKHRGYGDTFYIDEVFAVTTRPESRTIQINGKQHYLWRAVDQDGEVVDAYLLAKRDGAAARRFFKRLLRPTDCIKDRGAGYYYWGDEQNLLQALEVARQHPVDWASLKKWHGGEGQSEEFEKFRQGVES